MSGRARLRPLPGQAVARREVEVWATIFADGHDVLRAVVRYRAPGAAGLGSRRRWSRSATTAGTARSRSTSSAAGSTRSTAWIDRYASWRHELERKVEAGQTDLDSELAEGAALLGLQRLTVDKALDPALDPPSWSVAETTLAPAARAGRRSRARALRRLVRALPALVGRLRRASRSSCPELAELGFDVVYFPPIHPIGRTHRKGPNNALVRRPDDPGSPWAIGGPEGGHTAIHPGLGTLDDFDRLVGPRPGPRPRDRARPRRPVLARPPVARRAPGVVPPPPRRDAQVRGEPAQALPGHLQPQLRVGGLAGALEALRDVVLFWVGHGVRIFRVDNPHTKPVAFWEWLIGEVQAAIPDTIFLAEAFTRPAMMATLAKAGFSQSYTYFTWRNTKAELDEYMTDLTGGELAGVLPAELLHQHAGHPPRLPAGAAAGRRSRRGSCSPRRSRRATASTPASSTARTCRSRRGARNTSTRRSTS